MRWMDRLRHRPDAGAFARIAQAALREAGVEGAIDFDAAEFTLACGAEPGRRWLLHNAYAEYLDAPRSERAALLRRYASALRLETPRTFEQAREQLVPLVRSQTAFALLELRAALDGSAPEPYPQRPLGAGLALGVAVDHPQAIAQVSQRVLDSWGVRFEEALESALRNLRERSQEPFLEARPGVFAGPWEDSNGASRIALPELFYRFRVRGEPVVMIPERSVLLVSGSQDPEGLCAVAQVARKLVDQPRCVSGAAFVLHERRWERFTPEPGSPLARELAACERAARVHRYTEQAELLRRQLGQTGHEIHAGSVLECRRVSGEPQTLAVWSDGIDSLLPRTDVVGLYRIGPQGEDVLLVEWAALEDEVGHRLEPTPLDPPRVRVRSFPDAEELERLRKRALAL